MINKLSSALSLLDPNSFLVLPLPQQFENWPGSAKAFGKLEKKTEGRAVKVK